MGRNGSINIYLGIIDEIYLTDPGFMLSQASEILLFIFNLIPSNNR